MYKLLIVDDEPLTLEYLVNCMDYTKLELELIGTSSNGNEGLEKIYLKEPDVVMMDIKMPGMTGIEVLNAIRSFENKPEVVFVSGYSDFQYMQKALQYGADNYILKPVSESDLREALCNAVEKVKHKRVLAAEKLRLVASLREAQSSSEYYMFKNYLFGLPTQSTEPYPPLPLHQGGSLPAGYVVLAITCPNTAGHSISFIFDTISNLVLAPSLQIFENNGFLAVIMQLANPMTAKNEVLTLAEKIESVLLTRYAIEISIGVGEICSQVHDLHFSYLQAQRVLLGKAFLNDPKTRFFNEIDLSETLLISNVKNTLYAYLQVQDRESIDSYVKGIFSHLESVEYSRMINSCSDFWSEIFIELNSQLAQTCKEPPLSIYDLNEMVRMIHTAPSILGVYDVICQVLWLMVGKVNSNPNLSLSKAIQNAVRYIDENCTCDITLSDVAHHVYLSNSRFSTVFSDEVGEPFSKYLTKRRVEKAKELMHNPYAKIYEISDMAGFKDARYFSTVFRKLEGQTPVQYMRNLQ